MFKPDLLKLSANEVEEQSVHCMQLQFKQGLALLRYFELIRNRVFLSPFNPHRGFVRLFINSLTSHRRQLFRRIAQIQPSQSASK